MKTKIEDSLITEKDDNFSVILEHLERLNVIQIIFPNSRIQLCFKNITIVHQRYFGNWYYMYDLIKTKLFSGSAFTKPTKQLEFWPKDLRLP